MLVLEAYLLLLRRGYNPVEAFRLIRLCQREHISRFLFNLRAFGQGISRESMEL
ncbi:MAG: hypothetical protein AAFY26_00735 [Cyanobacteria bacterium J06638_22]